MKNIIFLWTVSRLMAQAIPSLSKRSLRWRTWRTWVSLPVDYKTALFFLSTSTLGVGFLSFSRLCPGYGLLNIHMVMIVSCLYSLYSAHLIIKIKSAIPNCFSYVDLISRFQKVNSIFGNRILWALFFAIFSWIVSGFHMHLGTMVFIEIFSSWSPVLCQDALVKFMQKLIVGLAIFAIFRARQLQNILVFGVISNFAFAFLVFALFCQMVAIYYQTVERPKVVLYKAFQWKILKAFPTCLLAFANQSSLISVLNVIGGSQKRYVKFQVSLTDQRSRAAISVDFVLSDLLNRLLFPRRQTTAHTHVVSVRQPVRPSSHENCANRHIFRVHNDWRCCHQGLCWQFTHCGFRGENKQADQQNDYEHDIGRRLHHSSAVCVNLSLSKLLGSYWHYDNRLWSLVHVFVAE